MNAASSTPSLETAVLGGGCFWCLEAVFDELAGVHSVESGYAGGTGAHPTYEEVCAGRSGHAEVVRIRFDPAQLAFRDLLTVFFSIHDPTTPNRQGNDVGTQYRSAIFPQDEGQELAAREALARAGGSGAARHRARRGDLAGADRHHDRAARQLVAGRGLSSGLLGGRRAAQSLLPRRHSAQAAEIAQELRRPAEGPGACRLS